MNQTRVDTGLAMECAIALAARRKGIILIRNERLSKVLYAMHNTDAKTRKRMKTQSEWLVDKLLAKEPHLTSCELTGQGGNFSDATFYGKYRVPCSVKHNSKELGGHRLSRRNCSRLPFPGNVESTAQFSKDAEPLFSFLDDQKGRYKKNQKWQRDLLDRLAVSILLDELNRHDPISLFSKIISHESHYMLIGGTKGAMIDGFNFDGNLACRKVSFPSDKERVSIFADSRTKLNRLVIQFSGGFTLELRVHVKGRISPSCYGGSLTLPGVPSGFYREEQ